jgi:hypothetical protein
MGLGRELGPTRGAHALGRESARLKSLLSLKAKLDHDHTYKSCSKSYVYCGVDPHSSHEGENLILIYLTSCRATPDHKHLVGPGERKLNQENLADISLASSETRLHSRRIGIAHYPRSRSENSDP